MDARSDLPLPDVAVYQVPRGTLAELHPVARSDDRGAFSVPVNGGALFVHHHGYRPWFGDVQGEDALEVRLLPGAELRGRVVDDLGAPVIGARVWAYSGGGTAGWPHNDLFLDLHGGLDGASTTTGASGDFVLTGLAGGEAYGIRAASRYHTAFQQTDVRGIAGAEDVRLVLVPLARLRLRIIDDESGADVPLMGILGRAGNSGMVHRPERAYQHLSRNEAYERPADSGSLVHTFMRYPPGEPAADMTFEFEAWAPGYEPAAHEIELAWGEEKQLDVRLQRAPRVEHGLPVVLEARWLGARPFSGTLYVGCRSSRRVDFHAERPVVFEDGRATTDFRLPEGHWTLHVVGSGATGYWWSTPGPAVDIQVRPADEPAVAAFELRGNPVTLEILDESGAPVRGFGLGVFPEAWMGSSYSLWDVEFMARHGPAEAPFVYIPDDRVRLRAEVLGMGVGETWVDADGRGTPLPATIRLAP